MNSQFLLVSLLLLLVFSNARIYFGEEKIQADLTDYLFNPSRGKEEQERYSLQLGVTMHFLRSFIHYHGGEEALKLMTTGEVRNDLVLPFTEGSKSSVCDYILNSPKFSSNVKNLFVGKADIFVSHAWNSNFLEVVDAVEEYLIQNNDELPLEYAVVWFDIFTVNQHVSNDDKPDWWHDAFQAVVQNIRHSVVVFTPWNNPLPLTRTWCLWEIYNTMILTDSKLGIGLSQNEVHRMIGGLAERGTHAFYEVLINIDVEKSSTGKPADQEKIFLRINRTVGFDFVNREIFKTIRKSFVAAITSLIQREETKMTGVIQLQNLFVLNNALSTLFSEQHSYQENAKTWLKTGEIVEALGGDPELVRVVKRGNAENEVGLGHLDQGIQLYHELIAESRDELRIAFYKQSLGTIHLNSQQWEPARKYLEESFKVFNRTFPQDSFTVLSAIADLCSLSFQSGQEKNSFLSLIQLQKAALTCKNKYGRDYPVCLTLYRDLAAFYLVDNNSPAKAEEILAYNLRSEGIRFGNGSQTISTRVLLFDAEQRLGQSDKALRTLEVLIPDSIRVLTLDSLITQRALQRAGEYYVKMAKYRKAEAVLFIGLLLKVQANSLTEEEKNNIHLIKNEIDHFPMTIWKDRSNDFQSILMTATFENSNDIGILLAQFSQCLLQNQVLRSQIITKHICQESYRVNRELFGNVDNSTFTTLANLALAVYLQKNYVLADEYYSKAFQDHKDYNLYKSPAFKAKINWAMVKIEVKQFDIARTLLQEVLQEMRDEYKTDEHRLILNAKYMFAHNYIVQALFDDAKPCIFEVVEKARFHFPPEDPIHSQSMYYASLVIEHTQFSSLNKLFCD